MSTASEPTTTRRPIRALPALLVNQIAAGEVVDRPASVVKELVENSIDAGAGRITLELEQGGIELIRVTDDGAGIPADELGLAVAPHATSKISQAEDLDRIATMGFRGEALASIASVARLSIRSRFRAEPAASQLDVEGDRIDPVRPASGPIGTCVSVRNLFFNTPARRKFLRTSATEQGHCLDTLSAIAIAHPAVGFLASCDGRVVFDVPTGQGPRDRALAVLGKELSGQLLEVAADRFDDARGLTLWGLVGRPEIARATAKSQYLFLNGRTIRDKTVQHAVREAYRGLIEPGRYPTAVVMIEMDPGAVDVNVHPAKAEVRFRDQSLVHGVILRAVRDALRAADLTPMVTGENATGQQHAAGWELRASVGANSTPMFGSGLAPAPTGAPISHAQAGPEALVEYLKRPFAQSRPHEPFDYEAIRSAVRGAGDAPNLPPSGGQTPGSPTFPPGTAAAPAAPSEDPSLVDPPRPKDSLLQVHNSYVVTQDETGLLIVDQHALHERVMFEALLTRVTGREGQPGSPLESQRLLVPAVVKLGRAQVNRHEQLRPLLDRIGIAIEPLTPESIGVHAFPTFLFDRGVDPVDFITEIFEKAEAEDFAPGSEAALHEVLDMMACKAAIKAGDRLSDPELRDLLNFRELVERSSNCPHGRPTSIRLTIRELEKRFGRT